MTLKQIAARQSGSLIILMIATLAIGSPAQAGPLDGKTYILEMTSSQYDSGLAHYLVPPMARALKKAGLTPKAPDSDLVINIKTNSDVGRWIGTGDARKWLYTKKITIGISTLDYIIPEDGTPQFGVEVSLVTPDGDREDEMACQIELAVATAVAKYRTAGLLKVDGNRCLRK